MLATGLNGYMPSVSVDVRGRKICKIPPKLALSSRSKICFVHTINFNAEIVKGIHTMHCSMVGGHVQNSTLTPMRKQLYKNEVWPDLRWISDGFTTPLRPMDSYNTTNVLNINTSSLWVNPNLMGFLSFQRIKRQLLTNNYTSTEPRMQVPVISTKLWWHFINDWSIGTRDSTLHNTVHARKMSKNQCRWTTMRISTRNWYDYQTWLLNPCYFTAIF